MPIFDPPPCCTPEPATEATPVNDAPDAYVEWKSWQDDAFGQPAAEACAYFDLLWRRFVDPQRSNRTSQSLRVLEIGFGNGPFLGWCRRRGIAAYGIETSANLLARARAAGFDCAESLQALDAHTTAAAAGSAGSTAPHDDARFDLIVLFDVLEHLPEAALGPYLQALAQRLASGGRIVLRTPNGGSPFGLNNQYGDPTHASVLTANKLRYLCAQAGLAIVYCGRELRPLRGMPVKKWPARLLRNALQRLLERLVRFVFAPQPRGVLSANLLTVLCAAGERRPKASAEHGESGESRDDERR